MTSIAAPDQRRARPTVRAVAEAAGCSVGTVSKVLNGVRVKPKNHARVMAAAEELGYVINGAARSMRRAKTMTLGLVAPVYLHPQTEIGAVTNTMIRDMDEAGYITLVCLPNDPERVDTMLRRLVEHRVDGLFYFDAQNLKSVESFTRLGIPIIAFGFRDDGLDGVPLVTVDWLPRFEEICRRLKRLGHRAAAEIVQPHGRIMHRSSPTSARLRWRAVEAGSAPTDVRAALEQLMTEADRPTVVMAVYAIAVQVLDACDSLGIRVPDDLSLVSLTDSENAHLLHTPLSALRTDYELEGHAAAAAMLDALAGRPVADQVVANSVSWVERTSVGPAPPRPVRAR